MRHGQADQGAGGAEHRVDRSVIEGDLRQRRRGVCRGAGRPGPASTHARQRSRSWAQPAENAPIFAAAPRPRAARSAATRLPRCRRSMRSKPPTTLPFDEGCRQGTRAVRRVLRRPSRRKAMIHAFFAERAVAKIPDIPKDVRPVPDPRVSRSSAPAPWAAASRWRAPTPAFRC